MVKEELDPTGDTEDPSPTLEKQHFFSAMSCGLTGTHQHEWGRGITRTHALLGRTPASPSLIGSIGSLGYDQKRMENSQSQCNFLTLSRGFNSGLSLKRTFLGGEMSSTFKYF